MAKKTEKAPEKALPVVSVLERRLANPFGSPSVPITLKSGGQFEIRIVDSDLRPGRVHEMRHAKGWEFVLPEELDGDPDEYGLRVLDGRLVRGHQGREVLMKMPREMYLRIQAAKSERNTRGATGKALKESVAQETAIKFGSEAGDTVFKSQQLEVLTSRGEDSELEESA